MQEITTMGTNLPLLTLHVGLVSCGMIIFPIGHPTCHTNLASARAYIGTRADDGVAKAEVDGPEHRSTLSSALSGVQSASATAFLDISSNSRACFCKGSGMLFTVVDIFAFPSMRLCSALQLCSLCFGNEHSSAAELPPTSGGVSTSVEGLG